MERQEKIEQQYLLSYAQRLIECGYNSEQAFRFYISVLDKKAMTKLQSVLSEMLSKELGEKLVKHKTYCSRKNRSSIRYIGGRHLGNILEVMEFSTMIEYMVANKNSEMYNYTVDFLYEYILNKEKSQIETIAKVAQLKEIYELSDDEIKMLICTFLKEKYPTLDKVFQYDHEDKLCGIKILLNMKDSKFSATLRAKGKLRAFSLIGCDGDIADTVYEYLSDSSNEGRYLDFLCKRKTSKIFDLDSYPIKEFDKITAAKLIRTVPDARILIYGKSGVGKTEFARSLVASVGKTAYFLADIDGSSDYAFAAVNASNPNKEIVIVDEADNIINERQSLFSTSDVKKCELNDKLDLLNKQTIFITNDLDGVDKSVLRRFHLIIKFEELSTANRYKHWTENVKKINKILSKKEIKEYSKKYDLPISIVSNSVNASLEKETDRARVRLYFDTMLENHDNLRNGKTAAIETNSDFNREFLNCDTKIDKLLSDIDKYKTLTSSGNKKRLSFLFAGLPGTGKTEFAKYLAEYIGIEAYVVRLSDILSMWLGGTERNIAEHFKVATDGNKMLIIDEADSILASRENVEKSWERNQVNEFLAQMDSYKGVLACTTNYLKTLDPASLRRFDYKVTFNPLDDKKMLAVLKHFFSDLDFSDYLNEIKSLNGITCGDINIIASRSNFLNEMKASDIIEELSKEMAYKKSDDKAIKGFI